MAEVAALNAALQGLGEAYIQFGKAIQAIQTKAKAAAAQAPSIDDDGKKKRKKREKKPRKPSGYQIFMKEMGPKVKEEEGLEKQSEVMAALGRHWAKLGPSGKNGYNEKATKMFEAGMVVVKQEPGTERPKEVPKKETGKKENQKDSKKRKSKGDDDDEKSAAKKSKKDDDDDDDDDERESEPVEKKKKKKKKEKKKKEETDSD